MSRAGAGFSRCAVPRETGRNERRKGWTKGRTEEGKEEMRERRKNATKIQIEGRNVPVGGKKGGKKGQKQRKAR